MSEPDSRIYTLTYCSRNLVQGRPEEVRRELRSILAASRRNNAGRRVTGALLYNAGSFAQILEGPLGNVEQTFEAIQRDPRHGEVTVIQSGFAEGRQFPDWSMAFAGGSTFDGDPETADAFEAVFAGAADSGERMLTLLRDLMIDESDWLLMDTSVHA